MCYMSNNCIIYIIQCYIAEQKKTYKQKFEEVLSWDFPRY